MSLLLLHMHCYGHHLFITQIISLLKTFENEKVIVHEQRYFIKLWNYEAVSRFINKHGDEKWNI